MQFSNTNIIRTIVAILLQLSCCLSSYAIDDPTLTQPLLGSSGQVFVNATSTVTDQPNPFLTIENTHIIHNMVSAGIEEESKFFIPSDFKATIKLHIITYNQKLQIDEETDKEITIDYTKAEGTKYNGNQYLYLKNAYQVKVTITAIEKNVDWDVTKVLRIDNTLTATRDYVFDCFADIKGLTTVLDNANNELTASWQNPHTGLTEYDLEWAWIDESALASYQDNNQFTAEKIFNNNATRVTISSIAYNIPLLYDGQGRLFVRVRPAQIKHDGQRIEGAWTWQNAGQPVYFSYSGHENFLNWQASTSFAEEGKRKSVVQYFDGTLRNRQTVTKDNSTNTTVVAESFYDYQGRPVIQVLPAPTLNSIIQYSQNFNKAVNFSGYPKWAYDKLDPNMGICGNPALPLANTTGTSQYYSPNNEKAKLPGNNPDKYIPDAEGYPFTETRFTPDGRVAAQGGVGASHQLGSNHETKYIYESPAQQELDALFGTDAGYASHYFKNFVKDANGQYSVSYTDMHGRTVATALAGNAPQNLDALPSLNGKNFTKQLIDEQTNNLVGNAIITTKALAVPKPGLYKFNYALQPEQFQLFNCNKEQICYDCLYNLKITITSDCNNDDFPLVITDSNFTINEKLNDPKCNGNGKTTGFFNKDFEVQLPEGAYTISKVLTLSDSAKNIYKEVFVANNTCKTFQDFYDTEYKLLVEKSNCELTCESCKESIGVDLAAFTQKFIEQSGMKEPLPDDIKIQIKTAYQDALKNCDRICYPDNSDGLDVTNSIRQIMLMDMTPPYGQYAKLAENEKAFNIFGPSTDNNNLIPYQNPSSAYNDEFGVEEKENPAKLSKDEFVTQFQPSWAEQLLPYHPEYCKLQYTLGKLADTYQFEADLSKTNTWADAQNAQFTTVVNNVINLINKDPFFSGAGAGYKNGMLQKMAVYAATKKVKEGCPPPFLPTSFSMWQLAQSSVFCRNLSDVGCAASPQNQCLLNTPKLPSANINGCNTDWDMAWKNFRSLYLTERKKIISQYLLDACSQKNDDVIKDEKYQLRFIDYNNIDYNKLDDDNNDLNTFFDQLGKGDELAINTAKELAAEQYDATCKGYADSWIAQLEQCPSIGAISKDDSTWLVTRLVKICTTGSDENHYLGSSSIKPGDDPINDKGNLYTQFPDVIKLFLQNKGIAIEALCHPYLITAPAPYDKQAAVTDQQVITKPDSCQCDRLSNLEAERVKAAYAGNLSTYLQFKYGTSITQGAIDTLFALCTGQYECIFLPAPIVLPPVLQCNTPVKTCITCEEYQQIKNDFFVAFNQQAPIVNPQTQEEIDLNVAFEHFANFTTGFGKSWQDYVAFEKQCTGGNTIYLNLKMFLSGAYADKNLLMRDDLRKYNLLPLSDPYFSDPLLIANFSPVANHKATKVTAPMFADKGDQSVVDWVWIQLHDSKDSCKILATHTGLLQKDGFVINTDGSALNFSNMPDGQYYVSVRHRNHLGVITKTPVNISNGDITSIDFTDINTETFGTNAQYILNNKAMLWGGDGNANGVVRFNGALNDKDYLLNCLGNDPLKVLIMVYNNGDYNMNGLVSYNGISNDKGFLIINMLKNDGGASIKEQIPCGAKILSKVGKLRLKMFLGGAYDDQTGLMRDDLRTQKLLPYNDPYFTDPLLVTKYFPSAYHKPIEASPFMFKDQFNQSFKEQAIVDWVWIQLHDGKDACKIISTQSGLVLRNGDVIAVNGSTELTFPNLENGNYFVSVRHRNHIGAMTKVPIEINNIGSASVDFTNINTETFGADAQNIVNNKAMLWGGNGNANRAVRFTGLYNDNDYLLNCLGGDIAKILVGVYNNGDYNMNGLVSYNGFSNDKDFLLVDMLKNNAGNSIIEQIPACAMPEGNTVFVGLKMFLGGAYDKQTGLMNDDLRAQNLLPLSDPYFTDPQLVSKYFPSPYHKMAEVNESIFADKGDQSLVDWVWIQLHDAKDSCKVISTQSGFVQKDGFVKATDGNSQISFPNIADGQYYVSVRHRNHLGTMTKMPVNLTNGNVAFVNFTDINTETWGKSAEKIMADNVKALWPGDVNADKMVKFSGLDNDRVILLADYLNNDVNQVLSPVYSNGDLNLNGKVSYINFNNDKDVILDGLENNPNAINYEQIPYCGESDLENIPGVTLCGLNEPTFKPLPFDENPCKDLPKMAYTAAEEKWQLYKDSLANIFDTAYYNKCIKAKDMESLTVNYTNSEYHYTLYYYDQAGNLVKTIPPTGVDAKHSDAIFLDEVSKARMNVKKGEAEQNNKVVPSHTLVTDYRYNTLNQVAAQQTPDAGQTKFFYDLLGRLAVSQNAQQKLDKKYSYTLYDNLGRISEVGQKPNVTDPDSKNPDLLQKWLEEDENREQITRTVYDLPYQNKQQENILKGFLEQKNLRNRVSYSMVFDKEPKADILGTHHSATYFSYDIHGNVDTLLQDFNEGVMKATGNRFKKIAYDYDLISGKVNAVHYQSGWQDQFHHKYFYDAENRLVDVYTSKDSLSWQKDARYSYYRHGPLAKTILGQNQVQGIDYAYTLQGWLKGVNSTAVDDGKFDMGEDGLNAKSLVARDAFGFGLHYFGGDYKAINNTVLPFAPIPNLVSLYNGNIAAMSVNIPKVGEPLLNSYKYDQLNRLTKMNTYKGLNPQTNNWNAIAIDDYGEEISYDANGNIQVYKRNGSAGKLDMDKMTYQYPKDINGKIVNNRLRYVHDEVNAANYAEDIDSQTPLTLAQVKAEKLPEQQNDNYVYDAIGNLIEDKKEGINKINWNVYGKIENIVKANTAINYLYDASGNRISKTISNNQPIKQSTFYVRDASGNVMSTYTVDAKINNGNLTQNEVHLYGSSRLGIDEVNRDVQKIGKADYLNKLNTFVVGGVRYELSNHLGNVLATVSDKKIGVDENADGIIDYYTADVISATDYAPFGMGLVGRKFGTQGRYGFNGKENDNEVKGEGNQQDYGMRIYDPRLGKFLSVDPLTRKFPNLTPYQYAGNKPIWCVDLDGLEDIPATELNKYGEKQVYQISSDVTDGNTTISLTGTGKPSNARPVTQGMSDKQVYRLAVSRMLVPGQFTIAKDQYLDEKYFIAEQRINYYFSHHATATMSKGSNSDKLTGEIHNKVIEGLLGDDATMSDAAVKMIDRRTSIFGKFDWGKTAVSFGVGGLIKSGIKLAASRFASMGSAEVRVWYNQQLGNLNTKVAFTEENAMALSTERNLLKVEARFMMKDRAAAQALNKTDPIRGFQYYKDKYTQQGFSGENLWEKIISGSTKPNAGVNEKFGIK